MKLQSICPSLYRLGYFKYEDGKRQYPKLSFEKSQYVYHIISVETGAFDVLINGKCERAEAGDVLYLLPGDIYRILPCGTDFSLYNLFFDFRDPLTSADNRYQTCVFTQSFQAPWCLPSIAFEDASALNKSGIFKKVHERNLKPLLYSKRSDTLSRLYERAALTALIADLLTSSQDTPPKSAVQNIMEYIRCNPEKDLSGNALSTIFFFHKNHINKLIKRETGKSLCEYVRYAKIEHAKTLLSEEGCSLSEISIRLGYFDYSHFYKAFYKETGIIPTEYLKLSGGC